MPRARPTRRALRRNEAGFTVVELLVALTLLSLLSVLLIGSLRFGLKAWERAAAHSTGIEAILNAQNLLRRSIGEAYPMFTQSTAAEGRVDFTGGAKSLSFLTISPMALGGSRSRFSLSVIEHDEHGDLMLTAMPELAAPDTNTSPQPTLLLSNVSTVELAYFGQRKSDSKPAWHNLWTAETALPLLVRLRVGFPSGDVRIWPDLLIATSVDVDAGCIYDNLTKRCRGR